MTRHRVRTALSKKARKGFRGYPVATVAYYGPDAERASKLRKGDKVVLSGRLVQIVRHRQGHNATTDDEWFIFDQVVIGGK